MCFQGVFVSYEENRVGWGCVDFNGKYFFSNNVIFNESAKGKLGKKQKKAPVGVKNIPLYTEMNPAL